MVDGNQAAGYIPVSDVDGTMTWTDPSTISVPVAGTVAEVVDADNDTKIQVEESADEDIIRFDVAGSGRLADDALDCVQYSPIGTIW
jgi:prophage tail gpP-like protein